MNRSFISSPKTNRPRNRLWSIIHRPRSGKAPAMVYNPAFGVSSKCPSLPYCGLTLVLTVIASAAWPAEVRRARVVRTTQPIRIDGVLDEEVWRNAPPIGEFIQADPFPGKPPDRADRSAPGLRRRRAVHGGALPGPRPGEDPLHDHGAGRQALRRRQPRNRDRSLPRPAQRLLLAVERGRLHERRAHHREPARGCELGRHLGCQDQDRRARMDRGAGDPLQDALLPVRASAPGASTSSAPSRG